jgi:tetraacyldisaccharide 4'-kinase
VARANFRKITHSVRLLSIPSFFVMIRPSTFRELVSGRRRGLIAAALRGALRLGETPYAWAMGVRNRRYDRGLAATHRVDVPVVSMGNLTLGGTGKTPLVVWVARFFRQRGKRVSIVSRGYAAGKDGLNDEARELELALPDVPHLQGPDRFKTAQQAIERWKPEVILLDDGFQHRRLERDLDVVLLDATEPFGFEHVFPRGTLREPLAGLARADVVLLSRADMISAAARQAVRERVAHLAPRAVWCEVRHVAQQLVDAQGQSQPLDFLAGKRVAAFCGIGNPANFRHTLETLGANVASWREFPDHHGYPRADVESLTQWATGADLAVCTRKDLVKLERTQLGAVPLWSIRVAIMFSAGQQEFESLLAGLENAADSLRSLDKKIDVVTEPQSAPRTRRRQDNRMDRMKD